MLVGAATRDAGGVDGDEEEEGWGRWRESVSMNPEWAEYIYSLQLIFNSSADSDSNSNSNRTLEEDQYSHTDFISLLFADPPGFLPGLEASIFYSVSSCVSHHTIASLRTACPPISPIQAHLLCFTSL